MGRLVIVSYLWGSSFSAGDVRKLASGLSRNLTQDFRFAVVTDAPPQFTSDAFPAIAMPFADRTLLQTPGCFARLRMFDPAFQDHLAETCGDFDRLACVDLDTVVTGPLDPVFDRAESFVIMQGGNSANPNPYGGALQMVRRGAHADVWNEFNLEAAAKTPHFAFPDDQGWLAAKIPNASAWPVGRESGIYCFRKPGWPGGYALPDGARLVTFRGNNQPAKHTHLDWVKQNWIE